MSNASESNAAATANVQWSRVGLVVAAAFAIVDAKSGEQRGRAVEALFVAVEQLRKGG